MPMWRDHDRIALMLLGQIDQRVCRIALRERDVVRQPGRIEQRAAGLQRMQGSLFARLLDHLRVAGQDHLVQVNGLLHIGQHKARTQPFVHETQRVVHGFKRERRSVKRQEDLHQTLPKWHLPQTLKHCARTRANAPTDASLVSRIAVLDGIVAVPSLQETSHMTFVALVRGAAAVGLASMSFAALAAGVAVRFDLSNPSASPFPSDRFTVRDWSQNTSRRVDLPKPDCAVQPSDCADIDVLNALDGFSTQPRISVPFTGDIDPATVNSDTIFLVNLGDTLTLSGFGDRVGINQVIWDPLTKTLVFQSDQLLQQHSRYVLVVTDGVRDARGRKINNSGEGDETGSREHGAGQVDAALIGVA